MVNTFTLTIAVGTGQECSKKGEAQLRRAVRVVGNREAIFRHSGRS
jgi:hypothetical protein